MGARARSGLFPGAHLPGAPAVTCDPAPKGRLVQEWSNWSERDEELETLLRQTPRASGEKQMFRECALEFTKLPLDRLEQGAIQLFHLYVPEHVERLGRRELSRSLQSWMKRQRRAWFSLWQWNGEGFLDLVRGGRAPGFAGTEMLRPGDTLLARALPGGPGGTVELVPCSLEVLSPHQAQALIGNGLPKRDTRQALLTAWAHREWLLQHPNLPRFHEDDLLLVHAWAGPHLWREVRVGAHMHLEQLHRILQALFGWEERHLHRFELSAGRRYRTRSEERDTDNRPFEYQAPLHENLSSGEVLRYSYNYLAGWQLVLHVDKEMGTPKHRTVPWCTQGVGHSPGETEGPHEYLGQTREADPGAEINRRLKALFHRSAETKAATEATLDGYEVSLLQPTQLAVACLLEAGTPLTWLQILQMMQHAGVKIRNGVRGLRQSWNFDPLLMEDPELQLVALNVTMLDYERDLLELLLESRVRKRGAPRHLDVGPFTQEEFEYFFHIFSADGPELVGWELALAVVLELHDRAIPWQQALLEVENRLGWGREAEPGRRTSWYEVRGNLLHKNHDMAPWYELRRVLRETRFYRTISLQETQHVQNIFEAYNRNNRALSLQTVLFCWDDGGETVLWKEFPSQNVRTGSPEQFRLAAAGAQVLIAPEVGRQIELLGLLSEGRRLLDLAAPHPQHWQRNLCATLGIGELPPNGPDRFARYEEYYEYGRSHGYVLEDAGAEQEPILHPVGWNPARQPTIHEQLLTATQLDRPLRVLCHGPDGPIWHLLPIPEEGLTFRGLHKGEAVLGNEHFAIWQIVRVHGVSGRERLL